MIIATTTQSSDIIDNCFHAFLQESGIKYVKRGKKGLHRLIQENEAEAIVVWNSDFPVVYTEGEKFFFHPSMAKNRIAAFRKFGALDPMIKAFDCQESDHILDCTLGLGADAIVASYFASQGRIVGLESSAVVACVVKWGMKLYKSRMNWLDDAIRRIEVVNQDYNDYLAQLPEDSFDIVYFDPMFRKPQLKSQAISPLRALADHSPVNSQAVQQAVRVARKRVVLKETVNSGEFARLGFNNLMVSSNKRIAYGVIDIRTEEPRQK
ncbi:MAG: class I SAM-dependent methyltransferase [Syntrophomonadaceae bacterium]|jgi:16S rRNA (guanine1516-N2)-methyltransferase